MPLKNDSLNHQKLLNSLVAIITFIYIWWRIRIRFLLRIFCNMIHPIVLLWARDFFRVCPEPTADFSISISTSRQADRRVYHVWQWDDQLPYLPATYRSFIWEVRIAIFIEECWSMLTVYLHTSFTLTGKNWFELVMCIFNLQTRIYATIVYATPHL